MNELRARSVYYKAHGLGNDYLVFEAGTAWRVTPASVRHICDRHRGVGADGIVVLVSAGPAPPSPSPNLRPSPDTAEGAAAGGVFRLRMFNPDGSEFERSGNGLRVFGAYLASEGRVGSAPFAVEAGGDPVHLQILGEEDSGDLDITVEMGTAQAGVRAVELDAGRLDEVGRIVHPSRGAIDFAPVTIGNPHCVLFRSALARDEFLEVAPFLSTHPAFPRGTNVQFAVPSGDRRFRALIWERGVGETSASGTSSCAIAVAAVARGLLDAGEIEVEMPGGVLQVSVSPSLETALRGPVREVCRGELLPAFLGALATGS